MIYCKIFWTVRYQHEEMNWSKSTEGDIAGVSTFVAKLWSMLNDSSVKSSICWSSSGESIIIKDQERLSSEVFPK